MRKKIQDYAAKLSKKHLKGAMYAVLEEVGNVAVMDYMVAQTRESGESSGAFQSRISGANTGNRLRTRSGRLAASVVSAWRFSQSGLPHDVNTGMRRKQLISGEGTKESIRQVTVTGGKIEGTIGSKVPYAEIHEKGGTTHPTITPKSRGYFWHVYMETGDDKWKAMALTKKDAFNVVLKPRPYLKPAVDEVKKTTMDKIFKKTIVSTWDKANI